MTELHRYFARRLTYLREVAQRFTPYPDDVIHDTYIKAVEAEFTYINDRLTDAYFITGIKRNAKTYRHEHLELKTDIVDEVDIPKIINREKLDEAVRLLPEFDRLVFQLYLRGVNMRKLSREAGISINTLNHTIKRSKEAIKARL